MIEAAKRSIAEIKPYVAGKGGHGYAGDVIKLSSNENTHGPSPRAIKAYEQSAKSLFRYPDSGHEQLRQAIGSVHGLPAEQIVCAAGSDELIGLLVQAFVAPGDEVLYSQHGFLMYRIYALAHGGTPVIAPEQNYHTDVDAMLASVTERTKVVFVANPNNPTGSYISKAEMHRLRRGLPPEVVLAIDDAYSEYVDADDYSDGSELVDAGDNTVMLRTFSKIYGLPALRLGWGYMSPAIADIINRVRGPFNVGSPALAAGIAAVEDVEYTARAKAENARQRDRLAQAFAGYGVPLPSAANFILVDFGDTERAKRINAGLAENGIIVRDVEAYGLPQCLRITIGTAAENDRLLDVLVRVAR